MIMILNFKELRLTRILIYERIINKLINKNINARASHIHSINIFM